MPGEISAAAVSALATVAPEPGAPKPEPLLVADGVNRHFGGLVAVDVALEQFTLQQPGHGGLGGQQGPLKPALFGAGVI